MDFKNGSELLYLCRETGLPISEIMKRREMELSGRRGGNKDRKGIGYYGCFCP